MRNSDEKRCSVLSVVASTVLIVSNLGDNPLPAVGEITDETFLGLTL